MANRIAELQKEKARCEAEAERFTNMDQFMAGNLDKEVYQKRRAEFTKEAERLNGLIVDMEVMLKKTEAVQNDGTKETLEMLEQLSDPE